MPHPALPPESPDAVQAVAADRRTSVTVAPWDRADALVASPAVLPTDAAVAGWAIAPVEDFTFNAVPIPVLPALAAPSEPLPRSATPAKPQPAPPPPTPATTPSASEPKAGRDRSSKREVPPLLAQLEADLVALQAFFTLSGAKTAETTSSEVAVSPPPLMHADVPPPAPDRAIATPAAPPALETPHPQSDRLNATHLGQPISVGYAPPPNFLGVQPDFALEPSYSLAPLSLEVQPPAAARASLERAELDWGEETGSLQPTPPTRLRAQTRDGELREFEFRAPEVDSELAPEAILEPAGDKLLDAAEETIEAAETESGALPADDRSPLERLIEEPPRIPDPAPLPAAAVTPADAIEISADRQQFNERQRIVNAQGNVVMRFARGILTADRVRVNLPNRYLVAEGDVAMRRGEQVLRGDRFEYQLVQDRGIVYNARGEINQRRTDLDFAPVLGNDPVAEAILPVRPLSDRVLADQPLAPTAEEGYELTIGGLAIQTNPDGTLGSPSLNTGARGDVYRVRFEADYVEFDSEGWQATNIRFTNDPFSPPELEVRADTADLTRLNEFQDEIITTNSRLVFDQGFSVPIFQDRILIDRREQEPGLFSIRFDDNDRSGLYLERGFNIINTPQVRWRLTPQLLVQRAILEEGFFDPDAFGIRSNFDVFFDERTTLRAATSLASLDVTKYQRRLRNNLRLSRAIGRIDRPHFLTLQYAFRDRLFNGSLGLQTVQSSFGAIFTSPVIALGDTGANLTYQASVQRITADTDRAELLEPDRDDDRVTLTRYQGAATVTRGFTLWDGEALPPTPDEGLRFTPRPVRPYLNLNTGLTTVAAHYSNGDSQELVSGSIGLQGQFGHFSRSYLDYTAFNITYSNSLVGDRSPFLFDRFVDQQVLSFGFTQQVYGPFRIGFQTAYNLDTGQEISTDYLLEYSRRTFGVILRYNPIVEVVSFQLRIGDFSWLGNPEPFGGSGIRPVVQGVTR